MADFANELDGALRLHYGAVSAVLRGPVIASPVESTRGFKARMRALEKHYGSKRAAAAATGVSTATWGRWGRGAQKPSPGSLQALQGTYMALKRSALVAAKGPISRLEVEAVVAAIGPDHVYYNRTRGGYRKFRADKLTVRQLETLSKAFADGKPPEQLADVAYAEIKKAYGTAFEFQGETVFVTVE